MVKMLQEIAAVPVLASPSVVACEEDGEVASVVAVELVALGPVEVTSPLDPVEVTNPLDPVEVTDLLDPVEVANPLDTVAEEPLEVAALEELDAPEEVEVELVVAERLEVEVEDVPAELGARTGITRIFLVTGILHVPSEFSVTALVTVSCPSPVNLTKFVVLIGTNRLLIWILWVTVELFSTGTAPHTSR